MSNGGVWTELMIFLVNLIHKIFFKGMVYKNVQTIHEDGRRM